jgi:hypothetical protein
MPLVRADNAQVSWDKDKSKWLIRIQIGEEVIRRWCDEPKDAGLETVRAAAIQTAHDEGYELEAGAVTMNE